MTKLHELLAAEKTPTGAWNTMLEETLRKFKNPESYFFGHSKSLSMIEASPANEAEEAKAREEKPVASSVHDTLEYALGLFAKAEDLQYRKNATNRIATASVMWKGSVLLKDLPVDELLGLEARIQKIRGLIEAAPTLDASKHWVKAEALGAHVWELREACAIFAVPWDRIPWKVNGAGKSVAAKVLGEWRVREAPYLRRFVTS